MGKPSKRGRATNNSWPNVVAIGAETEIAKNQEDNHQASALTIPESEKESLIKDLVSKVTSDHEDEITSDLKSSKRPRKARSPSPVFKLRAGNESSPARHSNQFNDLYFHYKPDPDSDLDVMILKKPAISKRNNSNQDNLVPQYQLISTRCKGCQQEFLLSDPSVPNNGNNGLKEHKEPVITIESNSGDKKLESFVTHCIRECPAYESLKLVEYCYPCNIYTIDRNSFIDHGQQSAECPMHEAFNFFFKRSFGRSKSKGDIQIINQPTVNNNTRNRGKNNRIISDPSKRNEDQDISVISHVKSSLHPALQRSRKTRARQTSEVLAIEEIDEPSLNHKNKDSDQGVEVNEKSASSNKFRSVPKVTIRIPEVMITPVPDDEVIEMVQSEEEWEDTSGHPEFQITKY